MEPDPAKASEGRASQDGDGTGDGHVDSQQGWSRIGDLGNGPSSARPIPGFRPQRNRPPLARCYGIPGKPTTPCTTSRSRAQQEARRDAARSRCPTRESHYGPRPVPFRARLVRTLPGHADVIRRESETGPGLGTNQGCARQPAVAPHQERGIPMKRAARNSTSTRSRRRVHPRQNPYTTPTVAVGLLVSAAFGSAPLAAPVQGVARIQRDAPAPLPLLFDALGGADRRAGGREPLERGAGPERSLPGLRAVVPAGRRARRRLVLQLGPTGVAQWQITSAEPGRTPSCRWSLRRTEAVSSSASPAPSARAERMAGW